ncbi:MAG: ribbon-helix-helix protein, CopG family [Acidimicrobiales bacterium]
MHRTQIMLTDEQYVLLKQKAKRSGRSIADLIRSAVAEVYDLREERVRKALRDSFGAWKDRDDIVDGATYVEEIRQPLGERLRELNWD